MTAQLGIFQEGVTRVSDAARGPRVVQTHWGYRVTESERVQARGRAFEWGGKILGAVCMLTAFGFWILPGAAYEADTLVMKMALSVSLLLSGLMLIWSARSGYNNEVQVNKTREDVRIGLRNNAGEFHVKTSIFFSEISSIYLMRSKKLGEPARLFLRIGNSDQAIEVADGRVEALELLRERLAKDISPKSRTGSGSKDVRDRPLGKLAQAETAAQHIQ